MWFRRALIVALLGFCVIAGREVWMVRAANTGDAIQADQSSIVKPGPAAAVIAPLQDIDLQIQHLRVLAWTCPLVAKCSPLDVAPTLEYLSLQHERVTLFIDAASIADQIDHFTDKGSVEADVLRFQFEEKALAYHQLLKEIDAANIGVPSEIAQALEPLH